MSNQFKRNLKVLNELITYCYKQGASNVKVDFTILDNISIYNLSCEIQNLPEKKIQKLRSILNIDRQRELEENFWVLGGDSSLQGESELSLVGAMLDEAEVIYLEDQLTISAKRLK